MSNQSNPRPISGSRPSNMKRRVFELERSYNGLIDFVRELHDEATSLRDELKDGKVTAGEVEAVRQDLAKAVEAIEVFNAGRHGEAAKLILTLSGRFTRLKQRVAALEENDVRQDHRLGELEDASAQHREILRGLAPKVRRLEERGGSISNFGSMVAAGFNQADRVALMQLRGANADMSDDEFAAWLLLETFKLNETVADHSNQIGELQQIQTVHGGNIAKNSDGITAVNARVDKHRDHINGVNPGGSFWGPLLFGVIVGLASIPFVTRALENGWLELIMVVGVFGLAFGLASEFANRRRKRALLDDSPTTEVDKTEVVVVEEERPTKSFRSKFRDFFVVPEVVENNQSTQVVSREVTDKPNGSSVPADESPLNEAPGEFAGHRRS